MVKFFGPADVRPNRVPFHQPAIHAPPFHYPNQRICDGAAALTAVIE